MKYLLVLAVVVVAIWIWRQNRREEAREQAAAARPRAVPGPAQPMLRCARCGVHLPAADAVAGRQGSYCSEAHRRLGDNG